MRTWNNEELCLDFGEQGHVRIPRDQIRIALLEDANSSTGFRILETSPWTRVPIVICDEKKVIDRGSN